MDYDAELRLHNDVLRRACAIRCHECVLDIGCGAGQTTREAARLAAAGSALGIDTAAAMIARARELADAEGLRNATFEVADAQVHRFPSERFDIAISRFGTMFFGDPVAAFSNIRRALRTEARLVMMVWQERAANEWSVSIQRCLAPLARVPMESPGAADAFSLANRTMAGRILSAAGFRDATFTAVEEPVYYGEDVTAALDWVRGFSFTREMLHRLDTASAERALDRLREVLAAHDTGRGIWFDSRAWIIAASCRP